MYVKSPKSLWDTHSGGLGFREVIKAQIMV